MHVAIATASRMRRYFIGPNDDDDDGSFDGEVSRPSILFVYYVNNSQLIEILYILFWGLRRDRTTWGRLAGGRGSREGAGLRFVSFRLVRFDDGIIFLFSLATKCIYVLYLS